MGEQNRFLKEAFSNQSSYCYPNSDVLINKKGIKDEEELKLVEKNIFLLKLVKLQVKGFKSTKFDIEHYLGIHKFLFGDLYSFAGKTRNENIKKGNTPFCRPEFIYNYLSYTLEEMNKKSRNINSEDELLDFLAYFYSEINIIHPFREGNGRVEREFFRQFVKHLNSRLSFGSYELDYSNITDEVRDYLITGSILSATKGDCSYLRLFFQSVLKPLEKINQLGIVK